MEKMKTFLLFIQITKVLNTSIHCGIPWSQKQKNSKIDHWLCVDYFFSTWYHTKWTNYVYVHSHDESLLISIYFNQKKKFVSGSLHHTHTHTHTSWFFFLLFERISLYIHHKYLFIRLFFLFLLLLLSVGWLVGR